jgi:multidrug resistance efflux pump
MNDLTSAPPVENTPTSPNTEQARPPSESNEWRKVAAQIMGIVVVLGAAVLAFWVWNITERHPRTDDATARANVVGIAPRVRGQISELNVQDNQSVAAGDVLFEIDPADYELTLQKAKAALSTLDQQIEVARAQDAQLKFQVKAAEASVERAKAELKQAGDTLQRLQPLLTNGFAKADDVDRAATAKHVAAAALAAEEQRFNQAQIALSALATLTAQRAGAVAAKTAAALELSYCKVVAPFQVGHQSEHFGGRVCQCRYSRILVAGHTQMVCHGKLSRSGDSPYGSGQRGDCLPLVCV